MWSWRAAVLSAGGVDDGGDIDGGEHGVHSRAHPGPDRRTGQPASLQEPVEHPHAAAPER